MPLSFKSESHGTIAFGFFNIESDMLLLQEYFFFADRFCDWVGDLACQTQNSDPWDVEDAKGKEFTRKRGVNPQVYQMAAPDIGDLMGAIHGVRFTGFIGNLYKLFPFPCDPLAFKQNPQGYLTQNVVTLEIEAYAKRETVSIEFTNDGQILFGSYLFSRRVFHELLLYVWQGGYPGWKDQIRPAYVIAMKNYILASKDPFFKGVFSS